MNEQLTILKFFFGYIPAVAVSVQADPMPRLADAFLFSLGGIGIPPVTCILGFLGVLLARPLALKREGAGWLAFALVSTIMIITVQLWVIESRPGALFAFVIAIGMGFSGYSLIELIGSEISAFIKRIIAIATGRLSDGLPEEPK